jgi:hypothetical protein
MGVGLRDAEEIDFPLDRHHVLMMFPEGWPEKSFVLERENVLFVNSLVASASYEFVFQHPDDPLIHNLIPKEPRPLMVVNQEPVFEQKDVLRKRLAPIFSPHLVKSAPDFLDSNGLTDAGPEDRTGEKDR